MWFRRNEAVDADVLRLRLREAVAWCEYVVTRGRGLRTVELLPPRSAAEIAEQDALGREPPGWVPTTIEQRLGTAPRATTAAVVTSRAAKIGELGIAPAPAEFLRSGRILCCGVGASLLDRACTEVSNGFLDDDDLPPCDTWIGIIPIQFPHLLAWVPAAHVEDVDTAMPYCPTEAYRWLTTTDPRLERALTRDR
jgi:hypothetical protein